MSKATGWGLPPWEALIHVFGGALANSLATNWLSPNLEGFAGTPTILNRVRTL